MPVRITQIPTFTVKYIRKVMADRIAKINDWNVPLKQISIQMYAAVMRNFQTEGARLGKKWESLSVVTLARRRKGGGSGSPRILQDNGNLRAGISPFSDGARIASVSTDFIGARTLQYGAKKGQYGNMRNGNPIPWGRIPARPFMALNKEDIGKIIKIATAYIRGR